MPFLASASMYPYYHIPVSALPQAKGLCLCYGNRTVPQASDIACTSKYPLLLQAQNRCKTAGLFLRYRMFPTLSL